MSDNLNENLQSKFHRYIQEKYKGRIPSFMQFQAEYESFIEQYEDIEDIEDE